MINDKMKKIRMNYKFIIEESCAPTGTNIFWKYLIKKSSLTSLCILYILFHSEKIIKNELEIRLSKLQTT